MNPRMIAMLAGTAGLIAVILYLFMSGSGSKPVAPSSGGSAVVVPVNPSTSGAGETATPSLPSGGSAAATPDKQNTSDYMVGDIRVRDHRSGEQKQLDIPPNIHPPNTRELPSSLTSDISQQVKKALWTCAAGLAKDQRGDKPRLEGQLTVAIKNGQLSVTSAVAQIRDVTGPSQDEIKACIEKQAVGMTTAARDQADLDEYGIAVTFAIP